MLRAGLQGVAKRTILSSSSRQAKCAIPQIMSFHTTSRRESEVDSSALPKEAVKGGMFGTGISEWWALPVGITFAVPMLKFDWYIVNEETQLAAVFVAFCVAIYTQGGDAIYKALDDRAVAILKEQNEAEDKVIEALESKLHFLQANSQQVEHFEAINEIREETYSKLNAAGAVKPLHDFKGQMEKVLGIIAQEEQNITEKTKNALLEEATANVTALFAKQKNLKKAALDSAIASIKGDEGGADPVQEAFVKFFKEKAAEAKKADASVEEKAHREAIISKVNGVAKSEGFYFQIDESGAPKLVV